MTVLLEYEKMAWEVKSISVNITLGEYIVHFPIA